VLSGITELGTVVYDLDEARRTRYLGEASETLPLYDEKRIGHPGDTLGGANTVLASTVHLGPWIHVSSELMHHSLLREGDEVQVRGRVVNLFERKGHRFIDLEVLVVANGDRPVAAIRHTAIYEPRKGS
jgi:hypothetical protein